MKGKYIVSKLSSEGKEVESKEYENCYVDILYNTHNPKDKSWLEQDRICLLDCYTNEVILKLKFLWISMSKDNLYLTGLDENNEVIKLSYILQMQ